MDVHVKLDGNGYIPDAYAKYADRSGLYAGTPTRSFPFEVTGVPDPLLTCRYNGPQPPDRDHTYTLRVYALDNAPQLREGFWLNELLHAMEGHVMGEAVAQLPARA